MKRLIVSLSIIAIILAVGFFAIMTVSNKNDRLYGKIEAVIEAYEAGSGVSERIGELERFFGGICAAALLGRQRQISRGDVGDYFEA